MTTLEGSSRNIGYVKWFNKKQGYGFIHVLNGEHSGKDIFVHFSSIREKKSLEQQYKYLIQGEYVEFLVEKAVKDNHKYHATDITGILENSILCETRHIQHSSQSHDITSSSQHLESSI
jgi:cold shock CspA family protein